MGKLIVLGASLLLLLAMLFIFFLEVSFYKNATRTTATVIGSERKPHTGRGAFIDNYLFPECYLSVIFQADRTYVLSPAGVPDSLKNDKSIAHFPERIVGPCGRKNIVVAYEDHRPEWARYMGPFFLLWSFLGVVVFGGLSVYAIWNRVSRKRVAT
jgi:hypothetical protein